MTVSAELLKSEDLVDGADDLIQPNFHAYGDSNLGGVNSGAWTKLPYNQTLFDSHDAYNTSLYRYVVPIAGKYFFRNSGYFSPVADGYSTYMGIYKNGSIVATSRFWIAYPTTSSLFAATALILDLEVDDYIEPYGRHTHTEGSTFYVSSGYSHFFGFRLSD